MKALITGITGFAGSHLAEHLLKCGDVVLGTSRDPGWRADAPPSISDLKLLSWDLAKPDGLSDDHDALLREFAPQVICHLAAISAPGLCGETSPTPEAVAVNVDGTRRVLELASALPGNVRVLFTSTSHVYGRRDAGFLVRETDAPQPHNGYGRTKLAAERVALDFNRVGGVEVVIARAFQHSGPRQQPPQMLPQWSAQLAKADDGPIEVYNLQTAIDFCDVRDVVRAYRMLAEHGQAGGVYNVGSGSRQWTGDIFRQLQGIAGDTKPVREILPGLRHNPIADISQLRAETLWRPRTSIATTLQETYTYWQRQTVAAHD